MEKPIRSSSRLAAKPSSKLSTLDKARLVLLKKGGVEEEGTSAVLNLQSYRDMYSKTVPPFFIAAVTAFVDAVSPSKKKGTRSTVPLVAAA